MYTSISRVPFSEASCSCTSLWEWATGAYTFWDSPCSKSWIIFSSSKSWLSVLGTNKLIGIGDELIIGAVQLEFDIIDVPLDDDASDTFWKMFLNDDWFPFVFGEFDFRSLEFGILVLILSSYSFFSCWDRIKFDAVEGLYTPLTKMPSVLLNSFPLFVSSDEISVIMAILRYAKETITLLKLTMF